MLSSPLPDAPISRQEERKAETRARIMEAADALFSEKGYAAASIGEIAISAGVAERTIYLHFGSKAGLVLSYFDAWMDAFSSAIAKRPVDESVAVSVAAALKAMGEAGWEERVEGPQDHPHPLVDHLMNGPLDIAGHVIQRWMREVATMTASNAERLPADADPLAAHARAMAVFTFWFAGLSAAHLRENGGAVPADISAHTVLKRLISDA